MERTTLRDPRVGEALETFLTVRYESDHNIADRVIKDYGITSFPTLLVLDAQGETLDEVWGNDAESLVADLQRVRAGTETLPALRQRLEEAPDDLENLATLVGKLKDRRPQQAVRLAVRALKKDGVEQPEARAGLLLELAIAEGNLGHGAKTLDALERLLTEYPETPSAAFAAYCIGNTLPILEPNRALALVDRALVNVEQDQRAGLENIRGHLLREAWMASLRKEAKGAGDDAELLNFVAWECFERGLLTEEATRWAERAVELSGRAHAILDTLANLYFVQDRIGEALKLEAEAMLKAGRDAPGYDTYEETFAKFHAVQRVRKRRR